ncbi:TfoX/Sxy family protein [Chitinophaga niabensis]|uniref:Transcriptional regulator of competence genes, TfoX/Sxy family n=1 Tax=Chitinophaga niabensis TaxID=536979 RepID=A0A1N6D8Z2_9BACT|nr:TfoX/Sxy family protein [Chitinophaga niabensis]SIN67197.1 Transcriptional regulator of competence genes, TfoX/Sxy family [Chitinophaga niabensis]
MAYSEKLADRLRRALAGIGKVEEKKMFGGLAFMVNGKMCLTAGKDRIMCRIDPDHREEGCETVIMGGRKYKGYVHVNENNLETKAALDHWVKLALDFNKKAAFSRFK